MVMFVDSSECGRGTVKGGRTSPAARQTQQPSQPQQTRVAQVVAKAQQPRIAEGLAVLVQHLVFTVGAFQVPLLRKQVEKYRLDAEEVRLAYQQLEESLGNEKIHYQQLIESERARYQNDIECLIEEHKLELEKLTLEHTKSEQHLLVDNEKSKQIIRREHDDQLLTLKNEFKKLQQTHEESLEILREENDAISEQVDEKRAELEKERHESRKLKEDYESREGVLKEQNRKLEQQITNLRNQYEEKIAKLMLERRQLREENDRLLGYGDDKEIGLQEVQSLRAVLELKQTEIVELQKALSKTTQKADLLKAAEEKARFLNARCEDLQMQLQRKSENLASLINENGRLNESFKEESHRARRLTRYNEELRWKLEQNKEVVAKVFEQAEESAFNRSILSSSYNERHSLTRTSLDRTMSFRERSYSSRSETSASRKPRDVDVEIEDLSPPTSPKVKGVVEKSDSVSYVLDLDENPEVVASRIVRRSFRNTTPPKNTPTKSPSNKRPRIRVSLSSSSGSAILSPTKNEPHSANAAYSGTEDFFWSDNITNSTKYDGTMDLEEDNEDTVFTVPCNVSRKNSQVDITLPALPSELDRSRGNVQALPTPKHLAGDVCIVSESNSEDESTSSSQL